MADLRAWLEARRPAAPEDLARRIVEASVRQTGVGDATEPDVELVTSLTEAASICLDAARSRPGRVRESAFELLMADALVTHACEAALESPDADAALRGILSVGADR